MCSASTSLPEAVSFTFASLNSAARTPVVATRPQVSEPTTTKLLLGAYLTDTKGHLQVSGTVSGSAASRVLKSGDILRSISVPGEPTRALNTRNQFNLATQSVGPDRRAALEIYRPGTGVQQVQVSFHTAEELTRFAAAAKTGETLASR